MIDLAMHIVAAVVVGFFSIAVLFWCAWVFVWITYAPVEILAAVIRGIRRMFHA